jgi:hypothetical protein
MRIGHSLIAVAVAAAVSTSAHAVDFSYSGFSTAAYAQSDTDKAYLGNTGQPEGIDKDGSFETDSKIGLQVTARFNDVFSATVQGVAYADLASDWAPRIDWAFVRVKAHDTVSLRAGYLRPPVFMFSDSVFVGYANTWVRPPLEIYNKMPVYQLRGADVAWTDTVGSLNLTVQGFYGDSETDVGKDANIKAKDWAGGAVGVQSGNLRVHGSYSELTIRRMTPDAMAPVIAGLQQVPAQLCGACAKYLDAAVASDKVIKIATFGAQYDDGKNLAMAEYARVRSEWLVIAESNAMYATLGRRFGAFTPYVTYGMNDIVSPTSADDMPIPALRDGLNMMLSRTTDQDSYSAGVRYDLPSFWVLRGAVLKLQYDRIETDGGAGILTVVKPGFDGKVNLLSLSFDALF